MHSGMPNSKRPKSEPTIVRTDLVWIWVHSIVWILDIYPYITLKMPKSEHSNKHVPISDRKKNIRNPNIFVRILAFFWFEPNLVPNDCRLSEIRTSSDFGIPLYVSDLKIIRIF